LNFSIYYFRISNIQGKLYIKSILIENLGYIELKNLEVYRTSRQLSSTILKIYCKMNFEDKKHIGDQLLRSADSVGANIAEGYGRFHFKDKVRFYYNVRGSHFETFTHWLELLIEREKISSEEFENIHTQTTILQIKLNNFIAITSKKGREKHENI
jgi:four helix bundle protein